jgi:hypothetical protein
MTKTPELEKKADSAKQLHEKLNALIRDQVIHTLGEPDDLLRVQVRPLWEHYYRVNIFVGANTAFARISNSYFVQTDRDGGIVASTPQLLKQYAQKSPASSAVSPPRHLHEVN